MGGLQTGLVGAGGNTLGRFESLAINAPLNRNTYSSSHSPASGSSPARKGPVPVGPRAAATQGGGGMTHGVAETCAHRRNLQRRSTAAAGARRGSTGTTHTFSITLPRQEEIHRHVVRDHVRAQQVATVGLPVILARC